MDLVDVPLVKSTLVKTNDLDLSLKPDLSPKVKSGSEV